MAFKEIVKENISYPEVFKFTEVGDSIEGVYMGERQTDFNGKGDLTTFVKLDTGEGGEKEIKKLSGLVVLLAAVKVGDLIRITYKGDEKNPKTGRTYKDFKVEVDE